MRRCMTCNNIVDDKSNFCPNCGSNYLVYDNSTPQYQTYNSGPYPQYNYQQNNNVSTTPPVLWGIVGFLIPILGLIFYIIWNKTSPRQAKAAGIGALIYVGIVVVFAFLFAFAIEYGS